MFSKVKVSPLKERTLPTLQLLAAQLALKCLIFSNGMFRNVKIEEISLLSCFILDLVKLLERMFLLTIGSKRLILC